MTVHITQENFNEQVLKSENLVLLDFGATWCKATQAVEAMMEEIASEYQGKAVIAKVDVDRTPDIPMEFGVRNMPAILFIKNGEVLDKQVGITPKNLLLNKLNKYI
jgi:thioredoxin 1